jgi:hypothetical protein
MFGFDTPDSPGGLYVNLTTFQARVHAAGQGAVPCPTKGEPPLPCPLEACALLTFTAALRRLSAPTSWS